MASINRTRRLFDNFASRSPGGFCVDESIEYSKAHPPLGFSGCQPRQRPNRQPHRCVEEYQITFFRDNLFLAECALGNTRLLWLFVALFLDPYG